MDTACGASLAGAAARGSAAASSACALVELWAGTLAELWAGPCCTSREAPDSLEIEAAKLEAESIDAGKVAAAE